MPRRNGSNPRFYAVSRGERTHIRTLAHRSVSGELKSWEKFVVSQGGGTSRAGASTGSSRQHLASDETGSHPPPVYYAIRTTTTGAQTLVLPPNLGPNAGAARNRSICRAIRSPRTLRVSTMRRRMRRTRYPKRRCPPSAERTGRPTSRPRHLVRARIPSLRNGNAPPLPSKASSLETGLFLFPRIARHV